MKQILEELSEIFATLHADVIGNPEVSISQITSNCLKLRFRWKSGQYYNYALDIDDIPIHFSKDDYCGHLVDTVNRLVITGTKIT